MEANKIRIVVIDGDLTTESLTHVLQFLGLAAPPAICTTGFQPVAPSPAELPRSRGTGGSPVSGHAPARRSERSEESSDVWICANCHAPAPAGHDRRKPCPACKAYHPWKKRPDNKLEFGGSQPRHANADTQPLNPNVIK